jgi:hypothetical protein
MNPNRIALTEWVLTPTPRRTQPPDADADSVGAPGAPKSGAPRETARLNGPAVGSDR